MCALAGWQNRIHPVAGEGLLLPTPLGMEVGNVMQRQNFVDMSSRYLASGKFSPSIADQTKNLLSLYHQLIPSDGFPEDDMRAYSAYRRAADDVMKELLELV